MKIQKETIINSNYIIPLFTVVILLAITYFFVPIVFETNDDTAIMYTLAGYRESQFQPVCIFSNVIYGFVISTLYNLCPYLPWYTIAQLMVIFISLLLIMYGLLKRSRETYGNRKGIIHSILLFGILYFFAYIYSVTNLQFSTTPAFAGAAACCVLLTTNEEDGITWFSLKLFGSVLLLLIAFWYRSFTGYVVFAFFSGCILYKNWAYNQISIYRVMRIVSLLIGCIAAFASIQLNDAMMDSVEWQSYLEYHKERTQYIDYGHVTYKEAPTLYDSLGWDEPFAAMTADWFFMDERFNANSLRTINAYSEVMQEHSLWTDIKEAFMILTSAVFGQKYQYMSRFLFMGLSVVLAWRLLKSKERLFVWLITGLGIGMICYLCLLGRFPLRSFNSVFIPMSTILVYMATQIKVDHRIWNISIGICCLVFAYFSFTRSYQEALPKSKNSLKSVEEYCIENKDNLYIYDTSVAEPGEPFRVYLDVVPDNMMLWGGSTMYSPIYYNQLRGNGFESFSYLDFFNDKVFLLSKSYDNAQFNAYMESQLDTFEHQIVDQIDNVYVHKYTVK